MFAERQTVIGWLCLSTLQQSMLGHGGCVVIAARNVLSVHCG